MTEQLQTGKIADGWSHWSATGQRWKVLCSDGRIRMATVLRDADTFFSLPARVSVRGKTITGSIYADTLTYDQTVWQFSADAWRANAGVLPQWPKRA